VKDKKKEDTMNRRKRNEGATIDEIEKIGAKLSLYYYCILFHWIHPKLGRIKIWLYRWY